jgi:hypothetical protein
MDSRRGLCRICYGTPGVRDLYPASKFGRRGLGRGYRNAAMPNEPTNAPPGSSEKVEELQRRAIRGESLWHPDDAR